jgi:hypothetical protein
MESQFIFLAIIALLAVLSVWASATSPPTLAADEETGETNSSSEQEEY